MARQLFLRVLLSSLALVAGCSSSHQSMQSVEAVSGGDLPGMPPVRDPRNIYSETRAGMFSPAVQGMPPRIYVPNTVSNTVIEIDPRTYKIVNRFSVGREPQHVTPSWDMKTLWALSDLGDSLTKIDPMSGQRLETIRVSDPYNMYYTPDGKYAIVVAEREKRLDFRRPDTMEVAKSLPVDCKGVDHMDFTADGRFLIASCEFSGEMIKVDVERLKVVGKLRLPGQGEHGTHRGTRVHHAGRMPIESDRMPQDVKASPDGKVFYIADMMADGVHVIDPDSLTYVGFIPTGKGAHGLYPSRDARVLYVSNRDEGSVSVIDFATRQVIRKWVIPNGGSPDMGGVSADGKVLWLSGRWHHEVYAFDTNDGHLLARIPVDKGPHGLCVWPQPGRYSLGHTGNTR